MKSAVKVVGMVVRIAGVIQVLLGVTFWTGHAIGLVPLHMAIGSAFVLGLWTLAGFGIAARAPAGAWIGGLVWGVVVLALGMTQAQILPGSAHWVVKVVHLLTALLAMGQAQRLGTSLTRGTPPRSSEPGPSDAIRFVQGTR